MVLRHAEIHAGAVSTDPAGAVSARYSRVATRNGLPLLPQFRRYGGALEFAQHPDLHELPHPGAEGQSEARAGARELENGQADRVGADPSHARLCFLQSHARTSIAGSVVSAVTVQVNHMPVVYHAKPHSMAWCLGMPSASGKFLRPEDQVFNLDWKPDGRETGGVCGEIRATAGCAAKICRRRKSSRKRRSVRR